MLRAADQTLIQGHARGPLASNPRTRQTRGNQGQPKPSPGILGATAHRSSR